MSWHKPVRGPASGPSTSYTKDEPVANVSPDGPQQPTDRVKLVDINRLLSASPPPPLLKNNGKRTVAEMDEYDAVSLNITAKLKKMDPTQRIYAESLVNKVLTYGLLCDLSKTSDVVNVRQSAGGDGAQSDGAKRDSAGPVYCWENGIETIIL